MNEIDRVMTKIHDELAKFRAENAERPTHLVLDIGAKQVIKMVASHYTVPPPSDAITYYGIPIIDLEKVIIIDSQFIEYSELASDTE